MWDSTTEVAETLLALTAAQDYRRDNDGRSAKGRPLLFVEI